MQVKPSKLMELYQESKLDIDKVIQNLSYILDNSPSEGDRYVAFRYLNQFKQSHTDYYQFLEAILISDTNESIRALATSLLGKYFINGALEPIKYVIENDKSYPVLITAIEIMKKILINESRLILLNKLKESIKERREIYLEKYRKLLKRYFRENKFKKFDNQQIASILINFLTISLISNLYHNLFYEIDEDSGTIYKLDLSDLELETKGLPFNWKNNINKISEITGLFNLKDLKILDLSNNNITHVKDLMNLAKLEHLNLSNNKIKDIGQLNFLNNLSNLRILDLHGNQIVSRISKKDPNLRFKIILHNYLEDLEERYDSYLIKS